MGQEEKPWFCRLQNGSQYHDCKEERWYGPKDVGRKMKCTQQYMSSESISPEDIREIKCKGK